MNHIFNQIFLWILQKKLLYFFLNFNTLYLILLYEFQNLNTHLDCTKFFIFIFLFHLHFVRFDLYTPSIANSQYTEYKQHDHFVDNQLPIEWHVCGLIIPIIHFENCRIHVESKTRTKLKNTQHICTVPIRTKKKIYSLIATIIINAYNNLDLLHHSNCLSFWNKQNIACILQKLRV